MSLQPTDPGHEALDRLRSEVALLRRAIESLAVEPPGEPIDYSPTLAELAGGLRGLDARMTALGERPLLALLPDQLRTHLAREVAQQLTRPVAELERARAEFSAATVRLSPASASAAVPQGRRARELMISAIAGAMAWTVFIGAASRLAPENWHVPNMIAGALLKAEAR